MRRADGSVWINSFAHGAASYELQQDYAAVKAALEKMPKDDIADAFVRLVLAADLRDAEVEQLKQIAASRPVLACAFWQSHSSGHAKNRRMREGARSTIAASPSGATRDRNCRYRRTGQELHLSALRAAFPTLAGGQVGCVAVYQAITSSLSRS
jgi:hypothetical protein